MVKKSDDKINIASKEVERLEIDQEDDFFKKNRFPKEPTLIINPVDPEIEEEKKVTVDHPYDFGQYIAMVRFKGAADYVAGENDKVGYQIAVIPSPYTSPDKGRVSHVTDFKVVEGNDIELAKDAMKEKIQNELIPEVYEMMKAELRSQIKMEKEKQAIDKKMNGMGNVGNPNNLVIDRPWFLHDKSNGWNTPVVFLKKSFKKFGKGISRLTKGNHKKRK